ncbi:TPA: type III-A CRISPR-associated protein Cas10/Csm1, partial [Candidatus Micrarchaeota archaeon]|nr:type III-A CRISPR-associated protein Cas10/Csm1 [Candidatus Micrarchaeota archaeon]
TLKEKREELGRRLDEVKARRFAELELDKLVGVFEPRGFGGEAAEAVARFVTCQVCGNEVAKGKVQEIDGVRFCPSCMAFVDLGRRLRGAEYLFLAELDITLQPSDSLSTYADVLAAFGYKIELLPSSHALKDLPPERPAVLYALKDVKDDDDKGLTSYAGPRLAVGRKFLVNIVPTKDDRVKHFGELAEESRGAPYLGVLRMDMDSLGKIFSIGLGNLATLSRTSTLSFLVSLFFEGWTERIAQEIGGSRIYTVYSGGDDLFFVGSWDAVVELARRIRLDLRRFTGRGDLGISGGIVLVHEKYPLYVAAGDADTAEKAAKDVSRRGGQKKHAVAFLGIALPWEEFGFDEGKGTAADWAARLTEAIEKGRLPRAVLERLQRFYLRYTGEREVRGEIGPWVWHAAYWLSRMRERVRDEGAKSLLSELLGELSADGFSRNIPRLALAARWAELATRKGG